MSRITVLMATVAVGLALGLAEAAKDPAAKCAAAKQNAAAKKIAAKLRCRAKALAHGTAVDSTCLQDAETKFSEAIAKAESKGGCVSNGDTANIEGKCDTCVASIAALTPATTIPLPYTCGQGPYPQCGGTCPFGLSCQAFISTIDHSPCGGDGSMTPPGPPSCSTSCGCVDPATACNRQPCGRTCSVTNLCTGGGSAVCCSGGAGPCDVNSSTLACCCGAASCIQPVGQLGSCDKAPLCGTGGAQMCARVTP